MHPTHLLWHAAGQPAYQQGRAAQGAEKIDADAVWINGVGLVERLPDGRWELTGPDGDATAAAAAATLGRSTSPAKAAAARANGKRGGWPKGRPRK